MNKTILMIYSTDFMGSNVFKYIREKYSDQRRKP
jgi:hypothetical protein